MTYKENMQIDEMIKDIEKLKYIYEYVPNDGMALHDIGEVLAKYTDKEQICQEKDSK